MELSSIYHVMDETFAYKVDEHKYVIRLMTKKNDVKKVQVAYLEKYFRKYPYYERNKVKKTWLGYLQRHFI